MTNSYDDLIATNQKIFFILGVAMSMVMDHCRKLPESEKDHYYWLIQAIESVVYKGDELPPFPESKL